MPKALKIAFVIAEVDPYSKAGGVGDVGRSLPKALHRLGHKVQVFTPLYGIIDIKKHNLKLVLKDLSLKLSDKKTVKFNVYKGYLLHGLPVYFIDNNDFFRKYKTIYFKTPKDGKRFWFFNFAVIRAMRELDERFDVINCHDWQAGLIPYLLRNELKDSSFFSKTSLVYTIHNLVFQGPRNWWEIKKDKRDSGRSDLPKYSETSKLERVNFIKRGVLNSDIISTVSETYAQEILTKKFGEELHVILKNREDRLFGIRNGIDYLQYNPNTDPGLYKCYDSTKLYRKDENKTFLQKYLGLPVKKDVPLISMIYRMTEQKGIDLIVKLMDVLMRMDVQFAILGPVDKHYGKILGDLHRKYPKKIGAKLEFDSIIATQFYAGSDMFLMPSRFEPCGICQLISSRYGSVPIVRAVGGLVDTISNYSVRDKSGIGFVFNKYHEHDLLVAIIRALETYKRKEEWEALVVKAMQKSFSWEIPAQKYLTIYKKAIKIKSQNGK